MSEYKLRGNIYPNTKRGRGAVQGYKAANRKVSWMWKVATIFVLLCASFVTSGSRTVIATKHQGWGKRLEFREKQVYIIGSPHTQTHSSAHINKLSLTSLAVMVLDDLSSCYCAWSDFQLHFKFPFMFTLQVYSTELCCVPKCSDRERSWHQRLSDWKQPAPGTQM